jgi:hypothetical protein
MDTSTLKSELSKVVQAFEEEGKPLSFAGIVPIYPGFKDTSYAFQVSGSFLEKNPKAIETVTEKLFQVLSQPIRRYVNRVMVYDPTSALSAPLLYPSDDLILINKLNYKPDPVQYYRSLEADD